MIDRIKKVWQDGTLAVRVIMGTVGLGLLIVAGLVVRAIVAS